MSELHPHAARADAPGLHRRRVPSAFLGYGRPMGAEQIAFNVRVLEPGTPHVPPGGDPAGGHSHTTIEEIYFVLEGEITLKLGDEVLTLGPRDAVLIPAATPAATRNHGDVAAAFAMVSVKVADQRADRASTRASGPSAEGSPGRLRRCPRSLIRERVVSGRESALRVAGPRRRSSAARSAGRRRGPLRARFRARADRRAARARRTAWRRCSPRCLRDADVIVRWEADELLALLPATDRPGRRPRRAAPAARASTRRSPSAPRTGWATRRTTCWRRAEPRR